MTREHKFALIIGFSLILLVAILISDHLSRARRTSVDAVKPSEVLLAESSLTPTDPLAPIDPPAVNPGAPQVATPAAATTTAGTAPPSASVPGGNQPHREAPTGALGDAALHAEVSAAGGQVIPGQVPTIVLPPTTSVGTPATNPAAAPDQGAPVAPLPASRDEGRYHAVQKGDTLYRLAEKYYGSGSQWKRLADANKDRVGTNGLLREGTRLRIPGAVVPDAAPASPPKAPTGGSAPGQPPKPAETRLARAKTYTVKDGDTLGDISRKALGSTRRWREILSLNGLDEEEFLTPGMVLKLPG